MSNYIYAGAPGSYKIETIMDALIDALAIYGAVPFVQGAPDGSQVSVDVPEGVPQSIIDSVIAGHDPAQPSRAEMLGQGREAALAALDGTDIPAFRQATAEASTIAELRAAVLALADVVADVLVVIK